MLRSHLAVAVGGGLLFVASAFAAKLCNEDNTGFPGVDAAGNIDEGNLGEVRCRLCLNTKNEKFTAKCSGNVPNESNANQKYKNSPVFAGFTKSLYKVKANGAAKFTGKGVGAP